MSSKIRWKVASEERQSCFAKGSNYLLIYEKGEIVKAKEQSFGIFTFDTKRNALLFCGKHSIGSFFPKLIRVRPIGRGKRPKIIFDTVLLQSSYQKYLAGEMPRIASSNIPKGTICYQSVEVLD